MTLNLCIASGSRPSGTIMGQLLRDRGVLGLPGPVALVSWGIPLVVKDRNLNARQPTDKLAELAAFKTGGLPTVEFTSDPAAVHGSGAWYARKCDHHGGSDIVPVWGPDEASWRAAAGWDYFTKRLDVEREYRVWVFRGRLLGIYEKEMKYPERFKSVGRNYKNGFAFNLARNLNAATAEHLHELCDWALTCLGLDFGAADIVKVRDEFEDEYRVLEVNTAPGIESPQRRAPNLLADCIAQWYRGLR